VIDVAALIFCAVMYAIGLGEVYVWGSGGDIHARVDFYKGLIAWVLFFFIMFHVLKLSFIVFGVKID